MCMGEVKSVDYPTVDDILSNEELKSSDKGEAEKVDNNRLSYRQRSDFLD